MNYSLVHLANWSPRLYVARPNETREKTRLELSFILDDEGPRDRNCIDPFPIIIQYLQGLNVILP